MDRLEKLDRVQTELNLEELEKSVREMVTKIPEYFILEKGDSISLDVYGDISWLDAACSELIYSVCIAAEHCWEESTVAPLDIIEVPVEYAFLCKEEPAWETIYKLGKESQKYKEQIHEFLKEKFGEYKITENQDNVLIY